MNEPKQHKIETVQDMIDCTNPENINRFINDLRTTLLISHSMKEFRGDDFKSEGFIWVDDNKREVLTEVNQE